MKKWIIILCMLMLCGCTPKNDEQEIPAISGKTYFNTVDEYGNEEHSKVWFGKDGSFVIKDNFFDGSYEINGTWAVSENVATLDVTGSGVGDFKKIIFEIEDEDTLILKTSLAGSVSDDVFSTTEVRGSTGSSASKPEENSTVQPQISHVFNTEDNSYFVFYNSEQKSDMVSMVELIGHDMIIFQDRRDGSINEFQGSFKEEDGYIVVTGSSKEYPFPERMVNERFLKIKDKNTLVLEQDFPISAAGDVFTSMNPNFDGDYAKFKHEPSDMCSDQYLPMIEFYSAGRDTFVFTENLYSQMGEIFGWFEESDKAYLCHVEDAHMLEGFAGADVQVIEFEKKDGNTLILKTDLCMSRSGDLFKLEP